MVAGSMSPRSCSGPGHDAAGLPVTVRGFTSRDFAAALTVVVVWGLNFVAMKVALRDFTPFQLGFFRYLFAVLPLIFWVRRPALHWRWLLAAGLAQVGQFALLFVALDRGMTSALASVVMQTQVFFTALLGLVLLGERLPVASRVGMAIAAVGLCLLGVGVAEAGATTTLLALGLNLAAALSWAVSNIVARRAQTAAPGYDPLQFVVWLSLVPMLPFAALSWWLDPVTAHGRWQGAGAMSWLAVAYLGWIATILAYALWTWLLTRHPASRVAPFSLAVPVVGLAAGMLMLGEQMSAWQWAGSACVVAALAVVVLGGRAAQRSAGPDKRGR